MSYQSGQEHHRLMALFFFIVASLTDALDGWLARVTKTRTKLGKFLDPLADKLLLLSGFIGLLFVPAFLYRPPLWVTVTIVFRDIVIITGLVILFLMTGNVRVQPNLLGKITTVFQMGTLIAILLEHPVSVPLWIATALLTIASGLTYVFRDLKLLKNGSP